MDDAKLALATAQTQLGKKNGHNNPALLMAQSKLNEAKLDLQYTTIKSPSAGTITNLHTTVGNYANLGKIQMALVLDKHWFIFANIKENNLGSIKVGNQAKVILNSYPKYTLHGRVASISNGVAHAPGIPDNYLPYVKKTHDRVRLAQRFPVQIQLNDSQALHNIVLLNGMSAMVTIYTRKHSIWNRLAQIKMIWHKVISHVI